MRGFLTAVNRIVVVLATLFAMEPVVLHAQTFQGGLRGTIRDAQGVIPGVSVTLINDANGVFRETVSNDVGAYSRRGTRASRAPASAPRISRRSRRRRTSRGSRSSRSGCRFRTELDGVGRR